MIFFRRRFLFWAASFLLWVDLNEGGEEASSSFSAVYVKKCENLRVQNRLLRAVIALEAEMPMMTTQPFAPFSNGLQKPKKIVTSEIQPSQAWKTVVATETKIIPTTVIESKTLNINFRGRMITTVISDVKSSNLTSIISKTSSELMPSKTILQCPDQTKITVTITETRSP